MPCFLALVAAVLAAASETPNHSWPSPTNTTIR